jgi:hypothetical protein
VVKMRVFIAELAGEMSPICCFSELGVAGGARHALKPETTSTPGMGCVLVCL